VTVVVSVVVVVVGKERIPRQNGWKRQQKKRDEMTTVKRKGSIENGLLKTRFQSVCCIFLR
jgi:hypothetical protein